MTGSQNFLVNKSAEQSLAGRVGILTLLPLSNKEIFNAQLQPSFSEEAVFRGFYPRLFESNNLGPQYVYPSYIQTYIERDVRALVKVVDLAIFKKFLGLCAARVGQLLNISALASESGLSMQTVNAWLSILQASYILFLLQPYHKNFNKRLVKSSKLYFYDTGIVASLLGIESITQLEQHYLRGSLFENFIIADIYKQHYNQAKTPTIYFWRDSHGHEVDCIIAGATLIPLEVKASMTLDKKFLSGLEYWQELSGEKEGILVYGGNQDMHVDNCTIKSWKSFM